MVCRFETNDAGGASPAVRLQSFFSARVAADQRYALKIT